MPPPCTVAELPANVVLVSVAVPGMLSRPPPPIRRVIGEGGIEDVSASQVFSMPPPCVVAVLPRDRAGGDRQASIEDEDRTALVGRVGREATARHGHAATSDSG